MTVIAFDGYTVAADTQATAESGYVRRCRKLWRAEDGAVLAIAGHFSAGLALMAWYNAGKLPKDFPQGKEVEDTVLLVFHKDRKPLSYEGHPIPMYWDDVLLADGSGKGAALGAMHMGATAKQAVEIAIKVCADCGGDVEVMELMDVPARSPKPAPSRSAAVLGSGAFLG